MPKEHLKEDISTPDLFRQASPIMDENESKSIVDAALAVWQPDSDEKSNDINKALQDEFPDDQKPEEFWHGASSEQFRDFFLWGHDHDFGHGVSRSGAMGTRHIEISTESIQMGFLPKDLKGKKVLDIGCWSGGDLLVLSGMGADVSAIEEHKKSAASATRLMELLGCSSKIHTTSTYQDDPDWRQQFDIIYCSGVLYHVTDPVLFLRICFSYLKPGGRLIIETKGWGENTESACHYSGSAIKGWNYFAPTPSAMARWYFDVGFPAGSIEILTRIHGRLLGCAVKGDAVALPETAGFSRPGSWLEGVN